jgi:hypothetical protein
MSDPNMLLNFANQNQMQQPLTQLGGGIAQIQQMRQERMAQEQAQNAYRQALDAYMMDQNPQNLMALYQTSQPLGMFDNVTKAVEGMTTAQRQQDVDEMSRIYAPLVNGNTDLAVQNIDQYISAYENAGDLEGVQQLRSIREMVEQGRIQEATGQMGVLLGAYQEGRDFLDNVHSMGQERRAETESMVGIFESAQALGLPGEEIDRLMQLAREEGNEPVQQLLYYATAASDGGNIDDDAYNDIVNTWNQRYFDRTAPFRDILNQAGQVEQSYEQAMEAYRTTGAGGDIERGTVYDLDGNAVEVTAGTYDIALMNAFQRMIDPATVREGDVRLQQSAANLSERARQIWDSFFGSGGQLTPEARRAILDMSGRLAQVSAESADSAGQSVLTYTDRIGIRTDDITGGFHEQITRYLPDGTGQGRPALTSEERARQRILQEFPEAEGMEGFADMTEEQLKANFPDVNFSQITATTLVPEREYALAVYPNELGDINRYSDTQFNETYMRTMDAMRAGIPANRALQWIEEQKALGRWEEAEEM